MASQYSKFSNGDGLVEECLDKNNNGKSDLSSYESSIIDKPDNVFTTPSIRKLQPGKTVFKSITPICEDQNMDVNMSATMLTPSSLAKLQPQSSLLKSKITNTYKIIENGVNSAEVYEIRSVLSDITNITQSTKQCLTNLTHVNERNSDILAGKVETKKKGTIFKLEFG